ncbi:2-polyprenyl-6-methoxyphenol hydroxylase [Athelia psychrophila]|uniref:2-polyprenyl-6-methoxyphenol hydroxylase n=1 Tax=Athelia psychrophila TaxID=1759441 RepID=A0A166RHU3_9AGAM|nr:2-polyprenyl-6-methoxyphenol hydroxylase [Fibularhizoctonia sp. CBS 109695]
MSILSSLKPTIIIGGGLGGLCLAQGLKRANLPFRVFERDDNASWRAQGYRIRVNGHGAQALQDTLPTHLWKLFEKTCAVTVPGFTGVSALSGQVTASSMQGGGGPPMPGPDIGPYTVDRTTLRGLLMLDLAPEEIEFGKEFTHYTLDVDDASVGTGTSASTTITAHFSDGSSFTGGLVVGADGLRSRVRREYQPDHVPIDTDGRAIYGKTPLTPAFTAQFPADALRNITLITSPTPPAVSVSIFLEPIRFPPAATASAVQAGLPTVSDYVYWVLASRSKTFGISDKELFALDHAQTAALSLSLTKDYAPSLRALLELQSVSNTSALRVGSFKPAIPVWGPKAYVTLLGDAVHAMSPSGGVGANTALRDAKRLCEALVAGEGRLTETAMGEYEDGMREYARVAIEGSAHGGKRIFGQPPFEECSALEL